MEKKFNIPKTRFLWVLMVLTFVSACKKECEKVSDQTLFQFETSISCGIWESDTLKSISLELVDNSKGQPGAQSICFKKFINKFSSSKFGIIELFQEKEGEYLLLINGKNEFGIFTKRDTTNSLKFSTLELISDRQRIIAYIFNGDTLTFTKPCPN